MKKEVSSTGSSKYRASVSINKFVSSGMVGMNSNVSLFMIFLKSFDKIKTFRPISVELLEKLREDKKRSGRGCEEKSKERAPALPSSPPQEQKEKEREKGKKSGGRNGEKEKQPPFNTLRERKEETQQ
jgi:hypothetical protein